MLFIIIIRQTSSYSYYYYSSNLCWFLLVDIDAEQVSPKAQEVLPIDVSEMGGQVKVAEKEDTTTSKVKDPAEQTTPKGICARFK